MDFFHNLVNTEPPADYSWQLWKSLKYFNIYRTVLSGFFVTMMFAGSNLPVLGSSDKFSFIVTSTVYLAVALLTSFAIRFKWPGFYMVVLFTVLIDIVALTIIMHSSGGIKSGLGMLLIVAIAGNSLLIAGRTANFFAAVAALSILVEQVVATFDQSSAANFTQAGILGATLFATAIASHILSKRLRETQALATQRGIDLANLAQLNEHIIKRMKSGVIVIDLEENIRLMNESARTMLGVAPLTQSSTEKLTAVCPNVSDLLQVWKNQGIISSKNFRAPYTSLDIHPSFTRIGTEQTIGYLIFLEDTSRMAQQAQQMKLASLGRLTASIAHEIRNPLGAISHAEQLLAESAHLDASDRRLTEIIHTHTERVNGIIENVLQLSRRGTSMQENIFLQNWLEKFTGEFLLSVNGNEKDVTFNVDPSDILIFMDPTQLHQIVWNLSHNGYRFSSHYNGAPKLELYGRIITDKHRPYLDIIDHGPGIDPATAQHIFEPFFTTDSNGTGLGLYIARELCELNNAQLKYIPNPSGGSCFRIEFSTSTAVH